MPSLFERFMFGVKPKSLIESMPSSSEPKSFLFDNLIKRQSNDFSYIKEKNKKANIIDAKDNSEEKYIQEQLDKMTAEDIAAGRGAPSDRVLAVYRENILSKRPGSINPEISRNREAEDRAKDINAPTELSFKDVIKPFYGGSTDKEISNAAAYANKNYPKILSGSPFRDIGFGAALLARSTDGKSMDDKIPIKHLSPKEGQASPAGTDFGIARAFFDPPYRTNGAGVVYMARPSDYYSEKEYNQILNHEMGHSMYSGNSKGEDVGGKNYFKIDNELITELAHAQRQHFLKNGKRFTKESFESFIKDASKNPKMLDDYAPATRSMFEHIIDTAVSKDENDQKRFKEAAKLIPALVQNKPPLRMLFSA